jgi:cellulose synthase/poly-beta-1,6-N-acetylglucosamine synthase-like glycosyltransferase
VSYTFIAASTSALAIFLVWLGYPLAIWLAAVLLRRRLQTTFTVEQPHVTVVLASRDALAQIAERVANLLDTDYPADRIRILVALDAGGAQTSVGAVASLDARVSALVGDAPGGKASSLNAAVRQATGDILVMADTAQRFDRRTIPELVCALTDTAFDAVSGSLQLAEGPGTLPVRAYWALEKWLRHGESLVHSSIGVTGAVYAVRRTRWPVIPDGTLLDDVYVPMKLVLAGARVGFVPSARAQEVRVFGAKEERRRKARTLTGLLQLPALIPGLLNPGRNPVLFQFLMHKYARLLTPVFLAVSIASGAVLSLNWIAQQGRVAIIATLAVLFVAFLFAKVRRAFVAAIQWVFEMQMAILQALANAARGEWNVWGR